MLVIQGNVVDRFPRHLVPEVMELVRFYFPIAVHGVRFSPDGTVRIAMEDAQGESVLIGASTEFESAFPEPQERETVEIVEEWDDLIPLAANRHRKDGWDWIDTHMGRRRQPHKSWKYRRATRYHAVNMFWRSIKEA